MRDAHTTAETHAELLQTHAELLEAWIAEQRPEIAS